MNNIELLKVELRKDEGVELKAYPGPVTGLPHIGIGHLLAQEQSEEELEAIGIDDELEDWWELEITPEQAEALLDIDVQEAIESLAPTWTEEELQALDPERFIALISMAFQMGGFKIQKKFPSFVKAMKEERWDDAADEMEWSNGKTKQRRSAWWKQTEKRCKEMADRMRHGTIKTAEVEIPSISDEPPNLNAYTERELLEELLQRSTNRSPQRYG